VAPDLKRASPGTTDRERACLAFLVSSIDLLTPSGRVDDEPEDDELEDDDDTADRGLNNEAEADEEDDEEERFTAGTMPVADATPVRGGDSVTSTTRRSRPPKVAGPALASGLP
jgi:hypothetical protein